MFKVENPKSLKNSQFSFGFIQTIFRLPDKTISLPTRSNLQGRLKKTFKILINLVIARAWMILLKALHILSVIIYGYTLYCTSLSIYLYIQVGAASIEIVPF